MNEKCKYLEREGKDFVEEESITQVLVYVEVESTKSAEHNKTSVSPTFHDALSNFSLVLLFVSQCYSCTAK